jgi:hypothetical protein
MEHLGTQSSQHPVERKCAWCGLPVNEKTPEAAPEGSIPHPATPPAMLPQDPGPSTTICKACAGRLTTYRKPVLVVSREWARLYEEIAALLRSRPDIQVVIDRRQAPRDGNETGPWNGPNRRVTPEPLGLK